MLHYFAYGSNLHPVRLMERVPSANLVATAHLDGYRLTFEKRSNDGSSKCNIVKSDVGSESVHGAIYSLDAAHRQLLDKFEGLGIGYTDTRIEFGHQGQVFDCFTYLAKPSHIEGDLRPYHWYKEIVVLGAVYLGFPASYVNTIAAVDSMDDPDESRRQEHAALVRKVKTHR